MNRKVFLIPFENVLLESLATYFIPGTCRVINHNHLRKKASPSTNATPIPHPRAQPLPLSVLSPRAATLYRSCPKQVPHIRPVQPRLLRPPPCCESPGTDNSGASARVARRCQPGAATGGAAAARGVYAVGAKRVWVVETVFSCWECGVGTCGRKEVRACFREAQVAMGLIEAVCD
ncbi:hypothetical protein BC830DRAFT_132238 [Chytriomyces sp. MP71]|nr:hypothetical protein BC830DRAFT_132238 [Chytriomyces sp. MP71]